MAFQITNQAAASALRGEDVTITVNQTQVSLLATIALGTKVTIGSSANVGFVSEIPTNGYILLAKPLDPSKRMDSVGPGGILLANEIITIG